MQGSTDFKNNPALLSRSPVLGAKGPLLAIAGILFVFIPGAYWMGGSRPELLEGFIVPWPALWAQILAAAGVLGLLLIPLAWVAASRTLDLLALFLAQNSLLLAGYFFLNATAWKIKGAGPGILETGSLVVLINVAGFAILFAVMGATYLLAVLSSARLSPLRAEPLEYDRLLIWFLRAAGGSVALVIALPMAISGTIPLLADDPVQARFAMVQSDAARALYHAGTAILPFITGGLILFVLRRPARMFGVDGWIAGAIVLIQILTSNRLPLAITLFATLTLFTLERKLPRLVLVAAFAGFLALFAGLSGFTAILRQDRSALEEGNPVAQSLEEAFLGDNLIDLRDAAWVFSEWDFQPLNGRTYLGGLAAMLPSGIFTLKKEWHLGLTGIRIVGWDPGEHFGLRITFFGESFLNFGPAGVVALAVVMGCLFGVLLRSLHLAAAKRPPCLHYNLKIVILMQMCLPLSNTSDAFTFWSMAAFLGLQWLAVDLPLRFCKTSALRPPYAPSRV